MRYDNGIYTVGWISAIDEEYFAARRFLKDQHEPKWKRPGDENHYTLGKVANHNIVATVLPQGDNGPTAAATLLKDLSASFPNVKVCLMVGVGGGAPSERQDIRLGDVVVSAPDWAGEGGNQGGVIHYDYARTLRNKRFESISYMNRPPSALLAAVRALSVKYEENDGSKINAVINEIFADLSEEQRQKYCRPDPSSDKLYSSEPVQNEGVEETPRLIERTQRPHSDPVIHRGTIASASGFMEDAQTRDILAKERGVLCFEMEAAGMMNTFPCLVIRGICDYSDKHWVKGWRGYAAMAAAAYARDLLGELPAREVDNLRAIYDLLPSEYKAPVGKALKYVFGDETNEEGFTQADVEESLSMGNNKDPKNARLAQEGQRQAKPGLDSNDVNARKEREILELKERMASMELERKKFEDMMKELRLQKEALEQEAKKYVDREKAREQEHEDVSCHLEAERQAKEKANSERRYVNGGDAPLHDAALNGKADVHGTDLQI
ncbi:nucleoside phosphorylase domain-containing protein [Trichoderma longibrachiatum]